MTTSEARIRANQQNALRSTGPKTAEGKERSRQNALKHGMTGAGIVLPNEDVAEIDRKIAAYQEELNPSGELGQELIRRMAVCSVRMDRGVSQETATLSERVRQAEAEFVAPEGLDPAIVAQLKAEAMARAMFDPSKEASLARKYEAAAERGFFRALKELRTLAKQPKPVTKDAEEAAYQATMASFFQMQQQWAKEDAEFDAEFPDEPLTPPSKAPTRSPMADFTPVGVGFDVPLAIGKRQ